MDDVQARQVFEDAYRAQFQPTAVRLFARDPDGYYSSWSVEVAWRCFKRGMEAGIDPTLREKLQAAADNLLQSAAPFDEAASIIRGLLK